MPTTASWTSIINLLSEIVVFQTYDFDEFLKKLIRLIIRIIPTDSCLIYFYDRSNRKFILIASKKPHPKLLGNIGLKKGEGITGWVAEHKKTVVISKKAYLDKRFKFFSDLPEDRYEAFLSVPIVDREGTIGVINLQNKFQYSFSKEQVKLLESVVKIIASVFEKIVLERRVDFLSTKLEERKIIDRAKGILMKTRRLDERSAYELLRSESMKKRKAIKEIAEALVLVNSIG